jgi:hypothetical protein
LKHSTFGKAPPFSKSCTNCLPLLSKAKPGEEAGRNNKQKNFIAQKSFINKQFKPMVLSLAPQPLSARSPGLLLSNVSLHTA